ncbi:aminoglycoside 6-adenylyltransferase [Furfurilactobacillus sp. WILCCON 0119]|uniref:aminoglycoside 6-adenylyltransferase n=1 Tax=Furfurilactobacillus entadae TaxID=2922307 RepID=UPI0035EE11ED
MKRRSAEEMMTIIKTVAEGDDNIRAIGMEGSRNDPTAKQDAFADFDITYFVKTLNPFRKNDEWLAVFGERLMMRKPTMAQIAGTKQPAYPYLMQFTDGNRLDLKVACVEDQAAYLAAEHENTVIFDKDHPVKAQPELSTWDFRITAPSTDDYQESINKFFWNSLYVVKGLKRHELLYANGSFEMDVRRELLTMLRWSVGIATNFQTDVGKHDERLKEALAPADYDQLLMTYKLADEDATWVALQVASQLFLVTARIVADQMGFDFPTYPQAVIAYEETLMEAADGTSAGYSPTR